MNENFSRHLGEVSITDLVEESVANAAQRKQEFMEHSLEDINEEEAKYIEGGLSSSSPKNSFLTTLGMIIQEPIFPS
ncbi:hypothetical protein [Crocosphaera chwakensis]|uniref:Uncharacterized protein n=1 Tax=Crocosphaera chwakensis CCY0110 TaxID=391612 RepID=A3IKR0_9CHRO|nr:hypothetical protein [Crocosphaera chwakensis]EAZ92779.1 hypothetical protein CY0110_21822 [Crocosphaera chwakensis CCY0110]